MHKKKVLFLIESMAGGGAEKVLTTLLQHTDHTRFDITLCCICNTGKYTDIVKAEYLGIDSFSDSSINYSIKITCKFFR